MKILNRNELFQEDKKEETQNLLSFLKLAYENKWLSEQEKLDYEKKIAQVNNDNKNNSSFYKNIQDVFSMIEKPIFSDKPIMHIQALQKQMGSELIGVNNKNINLFMLVSDFGINFNIHQSQAKPEFLTDILETVDKLIEGLDHPENFKIAMQYEKLEKELPQTIVKSKLNKL